MSTAIAVLNQKTSNNNSHANELAHFSALAARWWDPDGPSRPLLDLNSTRLAFIAKQVELSGAKVLDVGCGGGILSEALAASGAIVTSIDLSADLIEVAKLHKPVSMKIDYRLQSAESLAAEFESCSHEKFDAICCMEMLEHVPEPAEILAACTTLLKPSGVLVLSTLNRTPKAFALGIVAAEYLLNLVPRGTHRYAQFLKPSELARELRGLGFELTQQSGMQYNPLTRKAKLVDDMSINYLLAARRSANV